MSICKYWDIIHIDSSVYSSMIVNGFSYEHPFNFTSDNIFTPHGNISPGYWKRDDIPKLLDGLYNYELNGNYMTIFNSKVQKPQEKLSRTPSSEKSTFRELLEESNTVITNESFFQSIGMTEFGKQFFIKVPEESSKIILNFTFENDIEDVMSRKWDYPIPFGKQIDLVSDCYIWVSGRLNDGTKINHPLQHFKMDIILNEYHPKHPQTLSKVFTDIPK